MGLHFERLVVTRHTAGHRLHFNDPGFMRLTAELRELERNKIVGEMHANPGRVSDYPEQVVAGKNYPAAQYRGDYGTFIVLFDPATSLPAIVRTRDFDVLEGTPITTRRCPTGATSAAA
jgi:hypothetical protein